MVGLLWPCAAVKHGRAEDAHVPSEDKLQGEETIKRDSLGRTKHRRPRLTNKPSLFLFTTVAGRKRGTGALGGGQLDISTVPKGIQRLDRGQEAGLGRGVGGIAGIATGPAQGIHRVSKGGGRHCFFRVFFLSFRSVLFLLWIPLQLRCRRGQDSPAARSQNTLPAKVKKGG